MIHYKKSLHKHVLLFATYLDTKKHPNKLNYENASGQYNDAYNSNMFVYNNKHFLFLLVKMSNPEAKPVQNQSYNMQIKSFSAFLDIHLFQLFIK